MTITTFMENSFASLSAQALTAIFIYILLAVFILAVVSKARRVLPQFTNYAPTALTSLGILGTFAGIIIGLLSFDPNDIDNSISFLLNGLKTAFFTSLVGMLLSIVFKGATTFGLGRETMASGQSAEDISSKDFYAVMEANNKSLQEIKTVIGGDGDNSLLNILKLNRADGNDQFKVLMQHNGAMLEQMTKLSVYAEQQTSEFKEFEERLWRNLQEFADMLSKSATEQVVEALKQVIQDFNTNLTEQFGENFKQLNEACLKLVQWQEDYRVQLGDMKAQYDQGVLSITKTGEAVESISVKAEAIPLAMVRLQEVLEVNQHQINELDSHLNAFKDVRDKAVEAIPDIRKNIDDAIKGAAEANEVLAKGLKETATNVALSLVEGGEVFKDNVVKSNAAIIESSQAAANASEQIKEQMNEAVVQINNNLRNMFVQFEEGGVKLNKSFEEGGQKLNKSFEATSTLLGEESKKSADEFTRASTQIRDDLTRSTKELLETQSKQMDRTLRGLEGQIEDALKSTGESVRKQMDMVDVAAGAEIDKVMSSMGSALASISGQFTDDYSKLVAQMQTIVDRNNQ